MKARKYLLVEIGVKAGYMEHTGRIKLPDGISGKKKLEKFITEKVNNYINKDIDECFDLYIENELEKEYGTVRETIICDKCGGIFVNYRPGADFKCTHCNYLGSSFSSTRFTKREFVLYILSNDKKISEYVKDIYPFESISLTGHFFESIEDIYVFDYPEELIKWTKRKFIKNGKNFVLMENRTIPIYFGEFDSLDFEKYLTKRYQKKLRNLKEELL